MTYRDDNEALRAKVGALEEKVAELEDALAKRDVPQPTKTALVPTTDASSVSASWRSTLLGPPSFPKARCSK